MRTFVSPRAWHISSLHGVEDAATLPPMTKTGSKSAQYDRGGGSVNMANMTKDNKDTTKGLVSPSPPRGIKREQSDNEEGSTRRVSQRTETKNVNENEEVPSMKELLFRYLQSEDEDVLEQTLKNIRLKMHSGYVQNAEEARNEFFLLGGHSFLVVLMGKYPTCEGIQEQAMAVIANAASVNKKDLQTALVEVGGFQAVLTAMENFPDKRLIQRNGLASLTNLILSNETNAKNLVLNMEGIIFILNAIDRLSNVEDVARWGCKVLLCLCRVKELKKPIFDRSDALTTLAKARDAYKENGDIRECFLECIKMFAEYCKSI